MKTLTLTLILLFSLPALGQWAPSVDRDPMTDATTASVFTDIPEKRRAIFGIRCDANGMDMIAGWGEYLGDGARSVTHRIDAQGIETSRWTGSTKGTALFYAGDVRKFLETLLPAQKLALRTQDFRGTPLTIVVNLSGLTKAWAEIASHCKN